ncbi:hypothetical protein ACFYKX_11280 [Cytobacillus sp. FJAT-54145]|uniref:Uncharacterized protein n=1 Tax=Cytobacillus spartinae TaxID=3299023 RepID=A0ABW6KEP5_9BACI
MNLQSKLKQMGPIKSLKFTEFFLDEQGQHVYTFHYRIAPEAGLSHGNYPTFAKIEIKTKNPITVESLERLHNEYFRLETALKGDFNPDYITPISKEEYDLETVEPPNSNE